MHCGTLCLSEAAASHGVRSVEPSQESARDPPECCLSVAGAAGEQAAATTKSLNWTAPTASQQWAKHCGTLGLSEAAASQGVRSVEPSQESARDPPECCLSVAGAAGEQAAATTKSLSLMAPPFKMFRNSPGQEAPRLFI